MPEVFRERLLEGRVAFITGGEAMGAPGDVRSYAAVAAALARTREAWGPISILFCGAAGNVFAKTLAVEWGPEGVRVKVVAPGPVDDTEGMRRLAPDEAHRRRLTEALPPGRFVTCGEVAGLALFLRSEAAAGIAVVGAGR